MLSWSLKLFRIRGIQVAVHASFFLLLAWWAQRGWSEGQLTGLWWSVASLLAFFGCVLLHELGHSFTAMHFGIGVHRILLMPIGGMAEFDAIPRQPRRELLITLAGPAVNFLIAGALWLYLRTQTGEIEDYSINEFTLQLCVVNLYMGCFNLLPAFPMDGGRILRALLAWRMPYLKATHVAATIAKIICLIGAVIAAWIGHWLLVALFVFIFFAGEAEYRAVRRREIDDARWREVLARAYSNDTAAASEPPLLPR